MKICIDSNNHCHKTNTDGVFREVEIDFFDDKCLTFIEGYCCEVKKSGNEIYPWKPHSILAAAQAQYELMMAEAAEAYQRGINSI